MSDVTQILSAIEQGDAQAAERLLPLVYDALRRLARHKMRQEKPGQTLEATALVHEAYLRLVGDPAAAHWNSRGHFFAAAAEAMRRILIESARRKQAQKHGGGGQRMDLAEIDLVSRTTPDELLALDESMSKLADEDPAAAKIAMLHVFAGLSVEQAGELLGIPRATAYRQWTFARAWLRTEMQDSVEPRPA
jgi:RNA polymerase sigma factor (TIGR02999 family)